MRQILAMLLLAILLATVPAWAEDKTTVTAQNDEISDNLDLEAVASVFGEAKDLEDFEKRLNDPETQLSNLDLNGDGEVDYLRVMETVKGKTHYIAIQVVIAKDQFQDVATIEVEKTSDDKTQVQVVGDVYMYGPGYICEPVYVHPPVIFTVFWVPYYSPWHSPWYWGSYPRYYRPWRPYPPHRYRRNVDVNIDVKNEYNFTSVRKSKTSIDLQKKSRRSDFAKRHPEKSFSNRNKGVSNRQQLKQTKNPKGAKQEAVKTGQRRTGEKVKQDWQPPSKSGKAADNSGRQKPEEIKNSPGQEKPKSNLQKPQSRKPQMPSRKPQVPQKRPRRK